MSYLKEFTLLGSLAVKLFAVCLFVCFNTSISSQTSLSLKSFRILFVWLSNKYITTTTTPLPTTTTTTKTTTAKDWSHFKSKHNMCPFLLFLML